ncbi:gamma-glutamyltransferase family protein [Xenophilus sp. Marseille-Q4582]|uniref:gamma-glutamyltransferase family protein n=1 Tax=Xenophilus sp. Marseille-Q4582 TaxID=2866600 RepID=UPI001CE3DCAA|nr:gamma-glutamyltransferase [Xenophilus sp. Marseille-Q4582]
MSSTFTARPELIGTLGACSSTHWLASQTAMSVLERGGNAFDAAVAGGFVLQVVEPHLNGPAGEVPILSWDEKARSIEALRGQGCAPQDATAAAFRRLGLGLVPGIGLLAATVPAAFATWLTLLRDHGSWRLADVLAPAIGYARDGFPVSRRLCEAVLGVRALFLSEWHTSAEVWLEGSKVPAPGTLWRLPALANTYARIVAQAEREGQDRVSEIDAALRVWRDGFVAEEVDAFCRVPVGDSSGQAHAGFLRREDMANWRPAAEKPLMGRFGRYDVAKCGFWSQGPLFLQTLAMLQGAGLDAYAHDSADFVHRLAEATKLALADRLAWYGSAPASDACVQAHLLSTEYARERWKRVNLLQASRALDAGAPLGRSPRLPDLTVGARELRAADARFGIGEPTFQNLPPVAQWSERELFVGDTCHIDVIDRHGNMVAATPSGGWLSSSPAIPALGFALGTRLQMTWLEDGLPGSLTPGVAPCTTLSPSLALRDGEPYMVFGTPGGDQQDQWQLGFFLRHALHGMSMQEAIEAPSFHVRHYAASFWPRPVTLNRLKAESRFPPETLALLRERGHDLEVGEPWSEGRLSACSRTRDSHGRLVLRAAANPRGMQGYAVAR